MLDKEFDHIINKKVAELHSETPPSDWKAMAAMLRHDPNATENEAAFDDVIRDKVDTAPIVVPPANWDALKNNIVQSDPQETHFDRAISDKVSKANPVTPPSQWERLSGVLGHSTGSAHSPFDKAIKEKIEDAKPTIPAASWASLGSQLGHNTGDNDTFDQIIKEKVKDASPVIPAATWSLLSSDLGHDTGDNDTFDQVIKEKVGDASPDIPAAEWSLLSTELGHNTEDTDTFDQIIKEKVKDASPVIPAAAWALLSSELGHNTANVDLFDEVIKDKITHIDVDVPPADWAGMASKLDTDFDQVIRNKVDDAKVEMPSADWNQLSNQINDNAQLDEGVKASMSNYTTPYNESHWVILKEKLQRAAYIRNRLYTAKAFEALLAILLFWTFANYSGIIFHPSQEQGNIAQTKIEEVVSKNTDTSTDNNLEANNNLTEPVTLGKIKETNSNKIGQAASISQSATAATPSNMSAGGGNDGDLTSQATPLDNISISSGVPIVSELREEESITTDDILSESSENNESYQVNRFTQITSMFPIKSQFGLFGTDESRLLAPLSLSMDAVVVEEPKDPFKAAGLFAHVVVGYNVQSIDSPEDVVYNLRAYQDVTENMSYGLHLSKVVNKFEFGLGLQYQKIHYMPRSIEERYEDNGIIKIIDLTDVNYNVISIPAFARLHQPVAKNLTLFADVGLTVNGIGWTNYNFAEVVAAGMPGDEPIPAPVPQPGETDDDDLGGPPSLTFDLFQKDFYTGLFDKPKEWEAASDLNTKLYGTLNSGIGLQYLISNKVGFYGRFNIDQGLGNFKFGPNRDDINTFGFQLGMKYKLK